MMLQIKSLSKSFGNQRVISDMDFTIKKGEVVAVIGPSGSGKSTFLKTINQLVKPDFGVMNLNDKEYDMAKIKESEATDLRKKIGMVFQNFGLFSHLDVLGNITLGLEKVHGFTKEAAISRGKELIEVVGLSGKEKSFPNQLSGGQQQRVGIARAMASNPDLILFDEPTSALDPELVGEVLSVIKTLAKAGNTMIIVTHEMKFAKETADKIVFMENGEIIMEDSPEVLFSEKAPERIKNFTR